MSTPHPSTDKPVNGLRGLAHWRHDLLAGVVVSIVSLPLSSGIAIASGAPPIYGIISSIIAGLIFPLLGGSFVTISGPAAGLAPALLATMAALGGAGDADHVGAGYHMLLVVIAIVGVVQIIGARLGLARFAAIFPASVVEGMLGAIGLLILVKALPLCFGFEGAIHAHGFFEYVASIPEWLAGADTLASSIAVVCLAVFGLLSLPAVKRLAAFRSVPPHVYAVGVGVALAAWFGVRPELLISVPANPLDGITMPDFAGLFGSPDLWSAAAVGIVTLVLIDGVESLATAQAVDRIDPFKRRSVPNRVLMAMGVSNLVSSLCGGLTVIPGGVKSKTCIEAGGRTLWANFANAVMLLCFLFVAPALVSAIPKAALGAVLVYTGWKMVHPRIALHLNEVGREQLALYALTIVAMLATDLLVGILVGTALKLVFLGRVLVRQPGSRGLLADVRSLFTDPVARETVDGDTVTMHLDAPLVCFNAFKLVDRLDAHEQNVAKLVVDFGPGVRVVDHTAADAVLGTLDAATPERIELRGLDELDARSDHRASMREALFPRLDTFSVSGG